MAATRTETALKEKLGTLQPGSARYDTLQATLEFKRSWVALAEHLSRVLRKGEFKAWGYRTFEAYCTHELHLRRETAEKLTRSYQFLEDHEPQALAPRTPAPLPSYQALDVLARARETPWVKEADYRELRDATFIEEAAPSALSRRLRALAPEAEREAADDGEAALHRALSAAERLYGMLVDLEDAPERAVQGMETVIGALRAAVDGR